jgi:hypothetical protein
LAGLIALEVNQGLKSLPDWVAFAVLLPVAGIAQPADDAHSRHRGALSNALQVHACWFSGHVSHQ